MVRRIILIAVLWAACAQGALADETGFQLFRRLCIDTRGDASAALSAARADGFARPMAALTRNLPNLQLAEPRALAKLVDDGVVLLVVGHKPFPGGAGMAMVGCALVISPADESGEAALEAWAGAGRVQGEDGQSYFLFSGDAAQHSSAADLGPDDLAALARHNDLQIAGASHRPDASILIYGLVRR